jgi:hypothetical protein
VLKDNRVQLVPKGPRVKLVLEERMVLLAYRDLKDSKV